MDTTRRELLEKYEGMWILPDDIDALLEVIETAMVAEPAKVEYDGKSRTHFFQCWRYHHICAVAEIERLQEELAQALLKLKE